MIPNKLNIRHRTGVVAIFAAFQPGDGLWNGIGSVHEQVDQILVVDDTGGSNALQIPARFQGNTTILRMERNSGIAAALNRGVRYALDSGATMILTMDQDSVLEQDAVYDMVSGLNERQRTDDSVIGMAPAFLGGGRYQCIHPVGQDICSLEVIQSGMLLDVDIFRQIGLFREDLFIDGVDTEFVLRLHDAGFHVCLHSEVSMNHELGSGEHFYVWGRKIWSTNHKPFRRYYITRNRLWLLARFGSRYPQWARVSAFRLLRQSAIAALVEPGKSAKVICMARGVIDGLRGKLGPLPKSNRSKSSRI